MKKLITEGLGKALQNTLPTPLAKAIQPLLFAILGIHKMDKIHDGACNLKLEENFAEKLLHKSVMNIELDYLESDLEKIPKSGPLVVVANHPYGGVDGIALLALLKRVRPDVKLMANYILGGIPELHEDFFLVDPFGKANSSRKSYGGIKETLKWLKDGHAIGIFPSGEVSCYCKEEKKIIDKEWAEMVSVLIKRGKSPVVCTFFGGQNSKFFNLLGRINPLFRTLWLPRELARTCNHNIPLKIGNVIPTETCAAYKPSKDFMKFLKKETYALADSP